MNVVRHRAIPALGSLIVSIACTAAPASAQDVGYQAHLLPAARADFRVLDASIVNLDIDPTPGIERKLVLEIDGEAQLVDLWRHSVRAEGYQVLRDLGNGALIPVNPGPVRTVRGRIVNDLGSQIAGAVDESGLTATIICGDGSRCWVEPIFGRVAGANEGDHIVYAQEDVIPSDGGCGNETQLDVHEDPPAPVEAADPADGGALFCTQIAFDADFEYFQDYGTIISVENRINLVTNTMAPQYENETNITYTITNIIVRTSSSDPYTSTQSDALLCEFITEWTNNQQALAFDVAKLFTGKTIQGSTIGQAANIGDICDRNGGCGGFFDDGAYCYSQNDCCGPISCATDLMAHELGHLWDATHCDPCSTTMRSSLGCFNTFTASRISQIVNHRNSRNCLTVGGDCTSPGNTGACCFGTNCSADTSELDCEAVEGVFLGVDTSCVGNPCLPEVGACCLGCLCQVVSEANCVAFGGTYGGDESECTEAFCPACTGACCFDDGTCQVITAADCANANGTYAGDDVTCAAANCPPPVNDGACCFADGSCTEGTSNDCSTAGGSYQGDGVTCAAANCPPPDPTGACCATDSSCSVVTAADCSAAGGSYLGDGAPCDAKACAPPCPADLDGSGDVGFSDILQLIGAWGACAGCDEDLDDSGDVGFSDILVVIGAWGPC